MTNQPRALDYTTLEGQAITDLYNRIIASTKGSNDWGPDEISVVSAWLTELGFCTDERAQVPPHATTQPAACADHDCTPAGGTSPHGRKASLAGQTPGRHHDDGDSTGRAARSKDGRATVQETQR